MPDWHLTVQGNIETMIYPYLLECLETPSQGNSGLYPVSPFGYPLVDTGPPAPPTR